MAGRRIQMARKKVFAVNVTHIITISGTIEVAADDEEEAESLAVDEVPDIPSISLPEGWELYEDTTFEVATQQQ
jgi:hypothetical protein